MGNERTLNGGIWSVQSDGRVEVLRPKGLVPCLVNALDGANRIIRIFLGLVQSPYDGLICRPA
jgi:hypothetical protein